MGKQQDRGASLRDRAVVNEASKLSSPQAASIPNAWQPISSAPEDTVVWTKIDDRHGSRNETTLQRRGRLWWTPQGDMYVYYAPTHWRPFP